MAARTPAYGVSFPPCISSCRAAAHLEFSCDQDQDAVVGAGLDINVALLDLVDQLLGKGKVLRASACLSSRIVKAGPRYGKFLVDCSGALDAILAEGEHGVVGLPQVSCRVALP